MKDAKIVVKEASRKKLDIKSEGLTLERLTQILKDKYVKNGS